MIARARFALNFHNFYWRRRTIIQCAAATNIGTTNAASPIQFIFDLPLPFKVLNAQRLLATFAARSVQYAPILPCLLSWRVESVDDRINAFDAAEEHGTSLRVVLENRIGFSSSFGFSGSLRFSSSFGVLCYSAPTREHLHGGLLVISWPLFVVHLPHTCSASLERACAFDVCEKRVTGFEKRGLHDPIAAVVHDAQVAGSKRSAVHGTPVRPFEFGFEKGL